MLKYTTFQSKNFEFEKAFSIQTLNSFSEILSSGPNSTASIELSYIKSIKRENGPSSNSKSIEKFNNYSKSSFLI